MIDTVYVFQAGEKNPELVTYIGVHNGVRCQEAIGTPKFLAGPIIDLRSQGYKIILDVMPNGKEAKINRDTRMNLGALLT